MQTKNLDKKKYNGIYDAVTTIWREEGFSRFYTGLDMIPSIMYHFVTTLTQNCLPVIIQRGFNISSFDSPLLYGILEIVLNTIGLVVSLPLDTIRKRLQIQIRAQLPVKKLLNSSVRTRDTKYDGTLHSLYNIITEESKLNSDLKIRENGSGISQLYNGFSMHILSNVFTGLVSAFSGYNDDGDW